MSEHEEYIQAENNIQLAQILSDLISLTVCEPSAALALVSARPRDTTKSSESKKLDVPDPDLQRAKELVDLHHTVRQAHTKGELGRSLEEAREAVSRAVGGRGVG